MEHGSPGSQSVSDMETDQTDQTTQSLDRASGMAQEAELPLFTTCTQGESALGDSTEEDSGDYEAPVGERARESGREREEERGEEVGEGRRRVEEVGEGGEAGEEAGAMGEEEVAVVEPSAQVQIHL